MIAIIDYGAGNLRSVANAISHLGHEIKITGKAGEILEAEAVIFPGVGAAGDTMKSLKQSGLDTTIRELVQNKRPLMAICVGLQVLFTDSEEDGGLDCLDIIPGPVKRFDQSLKTPHMGWNQVWFRSPHPLMSGIKNGSDFYFVHSYYAWPRDNEVIAATSRYGDEFASIIVKGNLVATQFHPEKSGKAGLKFYHNFIQMALKGAG